MSDSEFGQQFINAMSLGSIYALVAIGLAMVFSILNLINFAHGEVVMLGAFFTYYSWDLGLPFVGAAVVGVFGTIVAGLMMERVAYKPLRGAPEVSLLLTSLGVSIAVRNVASMLFGVQPKKFPTPTSFEERVGITDGVPTS